MAKETEHIDSLITLEVGTEIETWTGEYVVTVTRIWIDGIHMGNPVTKIAYDWERSDGTKQGVNEVKSIENFIKLINSNQ